MTMKTFHGRCFWACTLLGLCCSLFLFAGCSGKPTASVTGKVTYKGQPVTGGNIDLFPADGNEAGRYRIPIKADGTFSTIDIPPGLKKVSIETESVKIMGTGGYTPPKAPGGRGAEKPPGEAPKQFDVDNSNMPKYVEIPKKYADPDKSGLTWEITKGKQPEKTFDLTD